MQSRWLKKSLLLILNLNLWAQQAIFQNVIGYLAHDSLQGRYAGSIHAYKAAQFLKEQLQKLGLQPFQGKYLHPYTIYWITTTKGEGTFLHWSNDEKTITSQDFHVAPYSAETTLEKVPCVFIGWGIQTGMQSAYADYQLKDKAVIVLEGVPSGVSIEQKRRLVRYADALQKAQWISRSGAKAVIVLTEKVPDFKAQVAGTQMSVPVLFLSFQETQKAFKLAGKNFKALYKNLQQSYDSAYYLPLDLYVSLKTVIKKEERQDYNVIGLLPATNGNSGPYIVVGAHYDHLGVRDSVYNGADDNASGSAMVVALAQYCAQLKQRKYPMLFAFWGGEELGLLGSKAWCEDQSLPMLCYINFDMVGRLQKKVYLQGCGSAQNWDSLLKTIEVLPFEIQADPYLPTDATSFYLNKVPVLSYFTGVHEDYHKPSDDIERINFQGMQKIYTHATQVLRLLQSGAFIPRYQSYKGSSSHRRSRMRMRVYVGTIPDYQSDVKGMRISGVKPGSPADKGGLQKGDVIIQIEDIPIHNIYDYMFVLQTAEPKKPLRFVVLRNGKKITLKIIPQPR